jgi:hypothetical protein
MIWPKNQGGLGELRDHVRRRDLIREQAAMLFDEKQLGKVWVCLCLRRNTVNDQNVFAASIQAKYISLK